MEHVSYLLGREKIAVTNFSAQMSLVDPLPDRLGDMLRILLKSCSPQSPFYISTFVAQ